MPEDPNPKVHPHPVRAKESAPSRLVEEDSSLALRARIGRSRARSVRYAELQVASNFSFLRGASHPEELIEQAAALGHHAIAITDRNSLAGIVRAHVAAKEAGVRLVVGVRVDLRRDEETERGRDEETQRRRDEVSSFFSPTPSLDLFVSPSLLRSVSSSLGLSVLAYPTDKASYARLCRLLTIGKRRAPKGECHLGLHDLLEHEEGLMVVAVAPRVLGARFLEELRGLKSVFGDRLSLAGRMLLDRDGQARLRQVAALGEHVGVAMVATNDVHMHVAQRQRLQDVLTCIRHGCTLEQAGSRLRSNGERYLKSPEEMARLFRDYPGAIARTVEIADRAQFSLDELRYEYPDEVVPEGSTAMGHLIELTGRGERERYPAGVPTKVRSQIEHELTLIEELEYAPYFLTVHELVAFARSRGILCQGRGAAANSAVCYCLGITSVDPDRVNLLFERFVSKERDEPPDIDIDFEHERREEVIQHVYAKYGRDRAALVCEVISYRGRSAIREVGKALGLSLDLVDRMARSADWWDSEVRADRLREIGLNPEDRTIRLAIELAGEIQGFPRHLSQHVGGFVITRKALSEMVPVENAAMPDRTVIEWDKDDVDAMGMLKVDCLGLGMLTCIRKALEFIEEETKRRRDEETKGRRDGETQREDQKAQWEIGDGECEDVSGSGGVAEGNGAFGSCVSRDRGHARERAVWADEPDEAFGGVDTLEHRRGIRARESPGPAAVPQDLERLAERAGDSGRDRRTLGDTQAVDNAHRTDRGDRPCSPRPDPKPQGLTPAPTSSLRLFVSSSLSTPRYDLTSIPLEDPSVYDMICQADTLGVFQIESRAQMAMSPRLKPRCYYDLVIEVAIVRPGPIQGKMVHPYLRRRNGEEEVTYPHPDIERVLGRTLGVPLFQEQAMALAMVAAGFSAGEADQLRRAMAAWKRKGDAILGFEKRLVEGMLQRGYARAFGERCFEQIKGFSGYGFPESHAASFAHLVYASAWIKRYHPAAFCAALLNSQPMGFYAPAQIVQDARRHGVEVRGIDVNESGWDCLLEERDEETERRRDAETKKRRDEVKNKDTESQTHGGDESQNTSSLRLCVSSSLPHTWGLCGPAIRLGMRLVKGLGKADGERIVMARRDGVFGSIESLWRRSGVRAGVLGALARGDAFGSMGLSRQRALWEVRELKDVPMPLFEQSKNETLSDIGIRDEIEIRGGDAPPRRLGEACEETPPLALPAVSRVSEVVRDYARTGLSLRAHPISFLRERLDGAGVTRSADLGDAKRWKEGSRVLVAGLTITRQRPATASGIVFITLEDETGVANLVVMPDIYERDRASARHGVVLLVRGRVERQGIVVHVKVDRIWDLDKQVPELLVRSRDFR